MQTTKNLDEGQVYAASDLDALCKSVIAQADDLPSNPKYTQLVYNFAEILVFRGYFHQSTMMCWEGVRRAQAQNELTLELYNHLLLGKIHLDYKNRDSLEWHIRFVESRIHESSDLFCKYWLLNAKADLAVLDNRLYEALRMYSELLDYFGTHGSQFNKAMLRVSMADVYYQLGDCLKAIMLLKEDNDFFEKKKFVPSLLNSYVNIGVYYSCADSNKVALKYYSNALVLARKIDDSVSIARIFSNMGNAKRKLQDYTLAEQYQDSALIICQKIQIPYGVFVNHLNRAELYLDQKKWANGLTYLHKAMQMTEFYGQTSLKLEADKLLSRAYEGMGDLRNALKYNHLFRGIKDSLDKMEANERLSHLESIFEKEKLTRELTRLKDQTVQSTMQNRLMIFVLICGLLIVMFTLYRVQGRRKLEELQNRLLEEEKERLELTVKSKEHELLNQALHQAAIREMADTLKVELIRLGVLASKKQKAEIDALIHQIELRTDGDQWSEFEARFAQVHEQFYMTLKKMAPDLNPSELKICGMLRLNMSSKEIALLTQRTVATIDNSRSTIRKKLNLPPDTQLSSFLLSM